MEKYPQGSPRVGEDEHLNLTHPRISTSGEMWENLQEQPWPQDSSGWWAGLGDVPDSTSAQRVQREGEMQADTGGGQDCSGGASRAAGLKQQGAWTRWEHAMDRKVSWMDLWQSEPHRINLHGSIIYTYIFMQLNAVQSDSITQHAFFSKCRWSTFPFSFPFLPFVISSQPL